MNRLVSKKKKISTRFKDDFEFIKGWLKNPSSVGSIKPSGRPLARQMAALLPIETGLPVLELGPGTGVITDEILKRGLDPAKLVSIEYSDKFMELLSRKFPDVNFVHGNAFDLAETLSPVPFESYCGAVSGIPLLNFPKEARTKLIENTLDRIEGDGPFIQMCYGPRPPVKAQPGRFTARKSELILRNIPPASIWVYRKDNQ